MAHLRPSAAIAARALLTPEPGAAMRIATALTGTPKMSNHAYGLWGYLSGRRGGEVTVQSLGIGAASAAIVLEELAAHGMRSAVAVMPAVAIGATEPATVPVAEALGLDGVSRGGGPRRRLAADPALTAALEDSTGRRPIAIATTDLPGRPVDPGDGAAAADLATAALLGAAAANGVAIGALAVVHAAAEGGDEAERLVSAAGAGLAALEAVGGSEGPST